MKHTGVNRVLFLVNTKGLGEQAEREFLAYRPNDDNCSFSELYGVRRLKSSFIPVDVQVCISTIQRMSAGYNLKCNTPKKGRQHASFSVKCSYHTK